MSAEPTLEQWNLQHVALSQAILGVISSNVRMVWLNHQEDEWVIHFVLERDDALDREDIDDAVTQFEALQDRAIGCRAEVTIESRDLNWPIPPARVVFRRKD